MLNRRLPAVVCAIVASFVLAQGTALAHPGALDLSFGHGTGEVTAQLGTFFDGASAVAQTSDGGVIIAGFVPTSNTAPIRRDLGLLALDSSGNPRAGFGTGGHVTIPLPGTVSASVGRGGITVAQRSDGSYLVGAVGLTGATFATPNQIVVDTVSAGGVAATASVLTLPAPFTSVSGVAADGPNGFIYFDGPDGAGPTHTVAVARVTVAGALDLGFGTAGVASQAVDAGNTANFGPLAVQSDGKPVAPVAGTKADNTTHEASLVRFTTGGQPDTSFGTGGVATLPASTAQITPAAPGRVVFSAAGSASLWIRPALSPMVVRFTSTGQPVTSFGGTGGVGVGNGGLASPSDLAFGDDGTVIVIGNDVVTTADSPGGARQSAYANRLLANGAHDTSFGDNPINGYGPFASWWNGPTDFYSTFASVMTAQGLVAVGEHQVLATPASSASAFGAARIITAANRPPTTSLAVSPGSAVNTATFRFTAAAHDPDFGGRSSATSGTSTATASSTGSRRARRRATCTAPPGTSPRTCERSTTRAARPTRPPG